MKIKDYQILYMTDGRLVDNGLHFNTLEQLRANFPLERDWLVIDPLNLPADFSVDTYTIEGGSLVPASAELIAIREAAALFASHEAVRVAREARYESEPIKSLYWSWIESGLEADRAAWIAAKNAVRTELPYPETSTAV